MNHNISRLLAKPFDCKYTLNDDFELTIEYDNNSSIIESRQEITLFTAK